MQDKLKDDARFLALPSIDRLKLFEEYMRELIEADKAKELAEREERRKKEKQQRENFRVSVCVCVLLSRCPRWSFCHLLGSSAPQLMFASYVCVCAGCCCVWNSRNWR